jgi:subfamily B ATP-binding cassette protein MsbA
MQDLAPDATYEAPRTGAGPSAPRQNAVKTYARVLGYAWHYKLRLAVSILFAVAVAGSLTSILLTAGTVLEMLYLDEPTVMGKVASYVAIGQAWADKTFMTRWMVPDDVQARATALVLDMRANRGFALGLLSGIVLALAAIGGTARFVQEYFAGSIGAGISVRLGEDMFTNIMKMPISFYEQRSTGEILARFTNDIFMVNRGLANTFVKLFREPFKIIFFLSVALSKDWQLTLIVLLVLPAVAYVIVTVGKKVKKSVRRSLQKIASTATVAAEAVRGIMVVKAYNMEEYETGRIKTELDKLRRYLVRMVRYDAAIEPATEFLLVVGLLMFMLLANRRIEAGYVNVLDVAVLLGALVMMMDPLRKLSSVNNMIQSSVASAERVFEFIDAKSDIVEAHDAVELPPLKNTLRFDNVQFSYNGKDPVLRGVSFEVKKGEMVALVGSSGAGKSTIVKMIPRFYDVSAGSVAIDGVDIRQATFKSLRDQIGIVTQDTILFNETVRENIAFGRETYALERIRQAALAAHAAEFIDKLPLKYDTPIGESGATLSGGQRQRLAIARAVIKDPAILILDEATSSLDSESEQAIQKAIEEFVVGRTTIVIAHRLSTVKRADRILVVDAGEIVEQGPHADLMAKNGLYRRLYDVQFGSAQP